MNSIKTLGPAPNFGFWPFTWGVTWYHPNGGGGIQTFYSLIRVCKAKSKKIVSRSKLMPISVVGRYSAIHKTVLLQFPGICSDITFCWLEKIAKPQRKNLCLWSIRTTRQRLYHLFLTSALNISVVTFTPRTLYPKRIIPRLSMNGRQCEPHKQPERFGEENKLAPFWNVEHDFLVANPQYSPYTRTRSISSSRTTWCPRRHFKWEYAVKHSLARQGQNADAILKR